MIEPRTALLILHAMGFALGLGVAIFLDVHMLRVLKGQRRVEATDVALLRTGSALVAVGLALLWLSGAGLTTLAWEHNPAFLDNPKLHAKLCIVMALTINGVLLHRVVLPHVEAQVGRGLFDEAGLGRRTLLVTCGAVSVVSWTASFLLGMVRELNFTVSAVTILGVYALALLLALAMALRLAPLGAAARAERRTAAAAPGEVWWDGRPPLSQQGRRPWPSVRSRRRAA
jgi:hypothetical protein